MKTVFVDVDTQIDFVFPAGALYVPGAERILPAVAELNRYAASRGIPLLSTVDAHSENDPEFRSWPAHCVAGTAGQAKPSATLVPRGQIVVPKQHTDAFQSPRFRELIDELAADRYVVYGVVTEICVRCAAFGLLQRGGRVEIVEEAVRSLDAAAAGEMLREFRNAGGRVASLREVLDADAGDPVPVHL